MNMIFGESSDYFLIIYHTCNHHIVLEIYNMPFPKKTVICQSHSVDLCTENLVIFFEEHWNIKIKSIVNDLQHI